MYDYTQPSTLALKHMYVLVLPVLCVDLKRAKMCSFSVSRVRAQPSFNGALMCNFLLFIYLLTSCYSIDLKADSN